MSTPASPFSRLARSFAVYCFAFFALFDVHAIATAEPTYWGYRLNDLKGASFRIPQNQEHCHQWIKYAKDVGLLYVPGDATTVEVARVYCHIILHMGLRRIGAGGFAPADGRGVSLQIGFFREQIDYYDKIVIGSDDGHLPLEPGYGRTYQYWATDDLKSIDDRHQVFYWFQRYMERMMLELKIPTPYGFKANILPFECAYHTIPKGFVPGADDNDDRWD